MSIADLPLAEPWLIALLQPKRRVIAQSDQPLVELDHPDAVKRAIDWLTNHAPEAIENAGGDQVTYEVACRLRDFGLSEPVAFDVLAEHWNEAGKASPPWPADELRQKVENAFAYATGAWGGASGLAEFDDATEFLERSKTDMGNPIAKRGLYRVPFNEAVALATTQTADPLVDGMIDQETLMVVYGPSNVGKTFVMTDIVFHIGTGRPWQGRETAKGLVVYVAAEGGRGIYKRLAALKKHYAVDDCLFDLVPCPINLLNSRADLEGLIALIREAAEERGVPVRMVVIDTLSRALAGGDESASTDMGMFIRNVDKIREAVKATFCIVHHTGKDIARGARGWSGLRGAIDTEIEIADGQITIEKQRDLEPIKPLAFGLERVDVGVDHRGRTITSCVIRVRSGSEAMKVELSPRAQPMFDAFEIAAREQAVENGRPESAWVKEIVTTERWDESYLLLIAPENPEINSELQNTTSTGQFSAVQLAKKAPPAYRTRDRIRTEVVTSGHVRKVQFGQWVSG